MEYKKKYDLKDVQDLLKWFDTHEWENQIDLGHGENLFDATRYIECYRETILEKFDNPTYSGPIYKLGKIKEELIRQGKVKDASQVKCEE